MPSKEMLLAVGKMHFELQRSGLKVSKANLCVDASNNVHLTVETSLGNQYGYLWELYYYKFSADNPSEPAEKVLLDSRFVHKEPKLESPSIAMDPAGNCHIAYTQPIEFGNPGDVYYAEQVSGAWQAPVNLSNSPTPSSEASIDVYGGKVYVTWTEEEAVGTQVYRRERDLLGGWVLLPVRCSEIGTPGFPSPNTCIGFSGTAARTASTIASIPSKSLTLGTSPPIATPSNPSFAYSVAHAL